MDKTYHITPAAAQRVPAPVPAGKAPAPKRRHGALRRDADTGKRSGRKGGRAG